jgi:hypothetical protein
MSAPIGLPKMLQLMVILAVVGVADSSRALVRRLVGGGAVGGRRYPSAPAAAS